MTYRKDLSPTLLVSVEIYKMELEGKDAVLSELEKRLPNVNLKDSINKCIDLGSVYADWIRIGDKWELKYYIYNGESKLFLQKILLELGELEIKIK